MVEKMALSFKDKVDKINNQLDILIAKNLCYEIKRLEK